MRVGVDYLFMLDDDQIIDIDNSMLASSRYAFLKTLVNHLEADHKKGIVGALYYQRDDQECWPVIMQHDGNGEYFFITHQEIAGHLQNVDVTGGGAMLINMTVFDKIPSPWFEPEFDYFEDKKSNTFYGRIRMRIGANVINNKFTVGSNYPTS